MCYFAIYTIKSILSCFTCRLEVTIESLSVISTMQVNEVERSNLSKIKLNIFITHDTDRLDLFLSISELYFTVIACKLVYLF